jgi:hypothetical protein
MAINPSMDPFEENGIRFWQIVGSELSVVLMLDMKKSRNMTQ